MLEVLKYIFSDFWIFHSVVILVAIIGEIIMDVLSAIFEVIFRHKK